MIFILTGEVNSGKTTFAREMVAVLSKRITIDGFLSVGFITESGRKEFDLLHIESGSNAPLAFMDQRKNTIHCGRYYFSLDAAAEGRRIIDKALERRKDLIVIDEAGKCELEGRIWDSSIKKVVKSGRNLLLTVNQKNLQLIIDCFSLGGCHIIDITRTSQTEAIALILNKIEK